MNVRLTTVTAMTALALVVTGCGSPEPDDDFAPQQDAVSFEEVESEDCDREDYENREDDCGFTDRDRLLHAKVKKQQAAGARPTRAAAPRSSTAATRPAAAPRQQSAARPQQQPPRVQAPAPAAPRPAASRPR